MTRKSGATFIRGNQYLTESAFPDGPRMTGDLIKDFKLPAGFWVPGGKCAAVNDEGPRDVCYFFCNDRYVVFDWKTRTCSEPKPISDWGLPPEFQGGVTGATNGRGKWAGRVYFFVGSVYATVEWKGRTCLTPTAQKTMETDANGKYLKSAWNLPWEFCTNPRCGVNGQDGSRRANTAYFVVGSLWVRYYWNTEKADQRAEGLGYLPAPFKAGIIAAMEGSLLEPPRLVPVAPSNPNSAAVAPPGLVKHLAEFTTSAARLRNANEALGNFDKRMAEFAGLARTLNGFVCSVLMEKELLERVDQDQQSALSPVYLKTQELQRLALAQFGKPSFGIKIARDPLVANQRTAAKALLAVLLEKSFSDEIDEFAWASQDADWADTIALAVADALAELGKSALEPEVGDRVVEALEGKTDSVVGKLLGWLRVEGKAAKVVAKSMSAMRGGDSLLAACLTFWSIRKAIAPTGWLVEATMNANIDKYAELILHHMNEKFAKASDPAGARKFREALSKRDFGEAKKAIGSKFSPTGPKWNGFALVFKFGELFANISKALESSKDAVDAASSVVGTANDTLKLVAQIREWKQVSDAISAATNGVGAFTSVCTIVSGGIGYADAIGKVDSEKAVGQYASVASGLCLLFYYVAAASSVAGPLFIVGISLGVIAAIINLKAELRTKTREQRALELLISSVEGFTHPTWNAGPLHRQDADLTNAVKAVREAFESLPYDATVWPTVKNNEATRAVLARLGLRGKIEDTLFPPSTPPAPPVTPPTAPPPSTPSPTR